MILKIQNKEYLLKYDVNALINLEELTGKTLDELFNASAGFGIIRNLMYVGLKRHQKEINLEQTGELIQEFIEQGQDISELSEILMKAFEEASLVKTKKK